MHDRRIRLYIKLIIIILCFIVVIQIFTLTISRYESNSNSNADIDIAFYLLKEDYKSMTLNLGKIVPRVEPYVYNFEITNEENGNIAETDLEYSLEIKTTTNLPLSYKLYMNEDYTNEGAKDIITSDVTEKDEDGTYFRTLKTDNQIFIHSTAMSNVYTLVINFPIGYNTEEYQNIIDSIEINVDSKQIIEEGWKITAFWRPQILF